MEGKVAMISVHPNYAEKIVSGEKKVEFRRSWAAYPVEQLVIYATSPIQRFVAIAKVKEVTAGSPTRMWELSQSVGGGISRERLFSYLEGKKTAVAIELSHVEKVSREKPPKRLLGDKFRPPQSFCYISKETFTKLKRDLGK